MENRGITEPGMDGGSYIDVSQVSGVATLTIRGREGVLAAIKLGPGAQAHIADALSHRAA